MAKIRRWLLLCLAVLSSAAYLSAQQEITPHKLAATYYSGHGYGGSSLTLNANGLFSSNSFSHDGSEMLSSGTYVLSKGALRFTVLKQTERRRGEKKETNLLEPDERKGAVGNGGSVDTKREFSLLPIVWSDRIYLIDEKDLNHFANAINLALEPRSTLRSEPYYGAFYLRKGDEVKSVAVNPSLPPVWLSFLLSRPVTATVISIEERRKEIYWSRNLATINKGKAGGLKVGMRLVINDEEPSTTWGAEIISVEEKTAQIRTLQSDRELKIGDKLSTRNGPKLDEYGALSWNEEKVRLEKFVAFLEPRPSAMGYIIAYAGRRARAGEALARANRARVYLEKELKMEHGRIVAVDGGYREEQAVELFAVTITPWVKLPLPTPTLNPAEVQIVKVKVKSNNRRRRVTSKVAP